MDRSDDACGRLPPSLLMTCRDTEPRKRLEIACLSGDFCSFVAASNPSNLVGFFREVFRQTEELRQLHDFHMRIKDGRGAFRIEIFYGEEKVGPQVVAPGQCISCFASAPLYPGKDPGVTAGECILEEFSDQPHVQCSLDAKARPGFIVTPVRHVERMSDLDDQELFALWNIAGRALKSAGLPFTTMILNHGTYRHLPHLHLKIWVDKELHRRVRMKWSAEKRDLWRRLEVLAQCRPRKRQQCMFFQTMQGCRNGDRCSFLHDKHP